MSISKELNGNVYQIPVTDETDWGDQMTPVITNLIDKVEQVNATNPVGIQLQEKEDNGTNKITLKAPESVTSDYTITLPPEDGIANQYLRRDSSGNMQWASGTTSTTLDEAYENGRIINTDESANIEINGLSGLDIENNLAVGGDISVDGDINVEGNIIVKGSPIFDVKSYGATGDGITDDTVAIQDAIIDEELIARVNGYDAAIIYFPKGTYKFADTLVFTKPVCIKGEVGTILSYAGTGIAIKIGPDGLNGTTYVDHLAYIIEDITFKGGEDYSYGIYYNEYITQPIIRRCSFVDFGNTSGYQLFFQSNNWLIRVDECIVRDGVGSNFLRCRGYSSGSVADDGNSRLIMTDCNITGNGSNVGVWVNGKASLISRTTINGYTPCVRIGSWASNCEIDSCYFDITSNVVGSKVIEFGDPDNTDSRASQKIQSLKVHDNCCDLHIIPLIGAITKYFMGPSGSNVTTGLYECDFRDNSLISGDNYVEAIKLNNVTNQTNNKAYANYIGEDNSNIAKLHTTGSNISPWEKLGTDVYNITDYGAIGDGVTNDSSAIQAAIDAIPAYGTQQNAYSIQSPVTLYFPSGKTYLINSELSLNFRNYLTIDGNGSWLKWGGSNDSRMIDAVGCNHLTIKDLNVNLDDKASQFIRICGGDSAGVGGKNNSTMVNFDNITLLSGYTSTTKAMIDTRNDTSGYSVDDSNFNNIKFREGYAGVRLASSTCIFDGQCEFVTLTKGIISASGGVQCDLFSPLFSNVQYPFYINQDKNLSVNIYGGYVESLNNSDHNEGCLIQCESGGSTTHIFANIYGGYYSQGAEIYVSSSSKFIDVSNANHGRILFDGVKFQSTKNGAITLGSNVKGVIKAIFGSASYYSNFPSISGNYAYERLDRDGGYFISCPSLATGNITVDSTYTYDDFGAGHVRTIETALGMIDQLGGSQVKITLNNSDTISTLRYLNGDLQIVGSDKNATGTVSATNSDPDINGTSTLFTSELKVGDIVTIDGETVVIETITSDTLAVASSNFIYDHTDKTLTINTPYTITGNNYIRVKPGGRLDLHNLTIKTDSSSYTVLNDGGVVTSYNCNHKNNSGKFFVAHYSGETNIYLCSHASGGIIICSPYGSGMAKFQDNLWYGSSSYIVDMNDSAIDISIYSDSVPTTGYWPLGARIKFLTPVAGGWIGCVCTTGGLPGTWKGYGAIES